MCLGGFFVRQTPVPNVRTNPECRMKLRFLFLLAVSLFASRIGFSAEESRDPQDAAARIAAIEQRSGGRLGVAALDTATKRRITHRADERFPMCSTFKLALAAAVLHRVDGEKEQLERVIPYSASDLLEYAPITKEHIADGGMTVEALCAAAIEYSDNTAANLLLARIGGPAGLTSYFRFLGDSVSRLDRKEPELNDVPPGDPRDTTAPSAMVADLELILLGNALSSPSRAKLEEWLAQNTTGGELIRVGVPSDWRVGDKTGRGGDSINDIGILRPPGRPPILLCIYLSGSKAPLPERQAAIAETARVVAKTFR
jgi:beta-lactamase class A